MSVKIPVGIDLFEEIRKENCYYVDKTRLIEELLDDELFKVNLITRPRRFGKTLNMSMLAEFFDIRKDNKEIFKGLKISKNKKLCNFWMNQWPVLFLTLKDVEGLDFLSAYEMLKIVISELYKKHSYLEDSEQIDTDDKELFLRLKSGKAREAEVKNAIYTILRLMKAYYGKEIILLIDEYDVTLAKSYENGYYDKMLEIIRILIGKPLKSNECLKFAVITGCLKIAKESIFTGANNFVSNTISEIKYSQYFGFLEEEVIQLFHKVGLSGYLEKTKKWYDGYRFGKEEVYCPWDVLNYVRILRFDPTAKPGNFWKNTSHNGIIRSFIDRTEFAINDKFELLLANGVIQEKITEDLTYDMLHSSESNLWSILYLTGYLTIAKTEECLGIQKEEGKVFLKIPNEEIKSIFADTILEWFQDKMIKIDRKDLFYALWNGQTECATELISDILFDTISYYDYKEDYYHAFLCGIFTGAGYAVESNHEYGLGRPDLVIKDQKKRRAIVMEIKRSKSEHDMKKDCNIALNQIDVMQYAKQFLKGYRTLLCYGVAFFEKSCLIKKAE